MNKRVEMKPTAVELEFIQRVKELGCQICFQETGEYRYAEFHHIRRYGSPKNHMKGIPLCPEHHRTGGHGVAIHAGKKTWEERYGVQEDLMEEAYKRMGNTNQKGDQDE